MQLELIEKIPAADQRAVPVLFVHGAWHGAWCWSEHFLPYFAEHGYAAYALSLRGHGKSREKKRLRSTRLADYVADVAEVIASLPETPFLVGHSMGGLVVQKYLEKNSVPGAVLLAPVPVHGVIKTTLRIARRHPILFLKTNLTFSLFPLVGSPELTREAFFSHSMPEDMIKRYFKDIQDESYFAFLDMLIKLPRPRKVESPIRILGADKDIIFYPDEIEKTARAYNVTPKIFPDMAHDMMLEPGWQSVADEILKWIDSLAP